MKKKFMKAALGTLMAAAVVPMTAMTAFAADEGHATLTAEGDSTTIPIYADVDKAEDTTTGDVISVDVSWSNTNVKAQSAANVYRWDPAQLKYVLDKESDEVTETAAGKADITITNRSNVDVEYTVEIAADSRFTEENASAKTGNIKTVATTIDADSAAAPNSAEYTADIRLGEGVNLTEAQDGYQLGSYIVTIGKAEQAQTLTEDMMFAKGAVTEFTYKDGAGDSHTVKLVCPDPEAGDVQNMTVSIDGKDEEYSRCYWKAPELDSVIYNLGDTDDSLFQFGFSEGTPVTYCNKTIVSEIISITVNGVDYTSQFSNFN